MIRAPLILYSLMTLIVFPDPEEDGPRPCSGSSLPLVDPVTDLELRCGGSGDVVDAGAAVVAGGEDAGTCPKDSYCHVTEKFAKCCPKHGKMTSPCVPTFSSSAINSRTNKITVQLSYPVVVQKSVHCTNNYVFRSICLVSTKLILGENATVELIISKQTD